MHLFPYDPMTEKVRILKKYKIFSLEGLRIALSNYPDFANSLAEAQKRLETIGCKFVDTLPFAYTKEELDYLQKEHKTLYPDN